jgi:hypothetical protein
MRKRTNRIIASLVALVISTASTAKTQDPKENPQFNQAQECYRVQVQSANQERNENYLNLNKQYITSLEFLLKHAVEQGNLTAVEQVQQQLSNPGQPITNSSNNFMELKRMQELYNKKTKELESAREKNITEIKKRFNIYLSQLQVQLTRQGLIEEAKKVRDYKKNLENTTIQDTQTQKINSESRIKPEYEKNVLGDGSIGNWPSISIDKDGKGGRLDLGFKLKETRTPKKVELEFLIYNHKYAGTTDRIEVYCDNNLVGSKIGAEPQEKIRILLDAKTIKQQSLELTIRIAGPNSLAITRDTTRLNLEY